MNLPIIALSVIAAWLGWNVEDTQTVIGITVVMFAACGLATILAGLEGPDVGKMVMASLLVVCILWVSYGLST